MAGERAADIEEPLTSELVEGLEVHQDPCTTDLLVDLGDLEARLGEHIGGKFLRGLALSSRSLLEVEVLGGRWGRRER